MLHILTIVARSCIQSYKQTHTHKQYLLRDDDGHFSFFTGFWFIDYYYYYWTLVFFLHIINRWMTRWPLMIMWHVKKTKDKGHYLFISDSIGYQNHIDYIQLMIKSSSFSLIVDNNGYYQHLVSMMFSYWFGQTHTHTHT